jgi:putative transcriptional regulator
VTPAHHLDHSTILAYAAGTLDESIGLVVASHLAWCPQCRAAVRAAEALGGELMEQLPDAAVSDGCRARTMAMLDGATLHRFPAPPVADAAVPGPLARLLPVANLDELPWKKKAPGVAIYDVKLSPTAKGQVKLLRIGPGRAVPEHGHGGEEVTLILSGAYRDHMGRFGRGDVADLDEDIEHKPMAEAGGDCICLVAIERPTRFKSFAARLMQPLVGI